MTDNTTDLTTLRAQLAQRDEQLAKAREVLKLAKSYWCQGRDRELHGLLVQALSTLTTPEHGSAG